jgi:hypothetical protein
MDKKRKRYQYLGDLKASTPISLGESRQNGRRKGVLGM